LKERKRKNEEREKKTNVSRCQSAFDLMLDLRLLVFFGAHAAEDIRFFIAVVSQRVHLLLGVFYGYQNLTGFLMTGKFLLDSLLEITSDWIFS